MLRGEEGRKMVGFGYFLFSHQNLISLNWEENQRENGESMFWTKLFFRNPFQPTTFCLFLSFVLFSKVIIVNLYKFYFLSFYFSYQPNKNVFHLSTFPSPLYILSFHFFYILHRTDLSKHALPPSYTMLKRISVFKNCE